MIPPPPLPWAYPALVLAALAAGAAAARRYQEPLALPPRQRWALGAGAFCGAMLGAKLPFALTAPGGPLTAAAWFSSGKTLVAGLAGGYLGVELAKRLSGVSLKTGDAFAVPAALSVGIGRLSCFAAGCCYGTPTALPWGVDFGDGLFRHPAQLYESAFHLAAAAALAGLKAAGTFRLQLMKLYIISYAAYRFLSEFLRPEPRLILGLSAYQAGSLALIVLFTGLWLHDADAHA